MPYSPFPAAPTSRPARHRLAGMAPPHRGFGSLAAVLVCAFRARMVLSCASFGTSAAVLICTLRARTIPLYGTFGAPDAMFIRTLRAWIAPLSGSFRIGRRADPFAPRLRFSKCQLGIPIPHRVASGRTWRRIPGRPAAARARLGAAG